tara:strand:+ start:237 stop:713 length:477 start_codon:yes stop_codon:yes gene_type:complete
MDLDAIENVTRESRDEEQHDKKARRKPWQPARMLETPTPPEGYQYRWIRSEYVGIEDRNNVSARMREGWEFVREDEIPDFPLPTIEHGRHAGVISVGGLILAKIPLETVAERNEHYKNRNVQQNDALDNTMFNELDGNNRYVKYNSDRQSKVSFGKKR